MSKTLKFLLCLSLSVVLVIGFCPVESFADGVITADYVYDPGRQDADVVWLFTNPSDDTENIKVLYLCTQQTSDPEFHFLLSIYIDGEVCTENEGFSSDDDACDLDFSGSMLTSFFSVAAEKFPVSVSIHSEVIDETITGDHFGHRITITITTGVSAENGNYIAPLVKKLEQSIKDGNEEAIEWSEGNSLPQNIMKTLLDNPTQSLLFSFEYDGVSHKVLIPAGKAIVDEDILWYGPLWLLEKYGEYNPDREYIIKEGDTLNNLAEKWGVSVEYLIKKNPYIKDKHWIFVGDKLVY